MIDTAVLQGGASVRGPPHDRARVSPRRVAPFAGAAAVGGLGFGIFAVWFSEQQIERAEERGSDAVSDYTKAQFSAMFMEDETVPDSNLDDTVRKMEAAMAAAKGEEYVPDDTPQEAPVKDDGW